MSESKDSTFICVALILGNLGTCDRKEVGALLVRGGRCVSWGYNGAPPGMPHCDENGHGWAPTTLTELSLLADELDLNLGNDIPAAAVDRWGCRNATHAEANAVAFAARQGISTEGATLYVTVSPCETCSRLLIAAGITRVVYHEKYRDESGIRLLESAEVSCIHGT